MIRLLIEALENSSCYKGSPCTTMFLLFPILFMYKHSYIVYLQEMKLMGMFAWTLMPLIVYLESLLGQSSTILAPQAIVSPGMHEELVIF